MLNFEISNFLDHGMNLAFSLRSARSRAPLDFATGAFLAPGAAPAKPTCPMVEMAGVYAGAYLGSYAGAPGTFWEPLYVVTIHDSGRTVTDPATGAVTTVAPRALFSLDVPFSRGSSTYSSPPFYTF